MCKEKFEVGVYEPQGANCQVHIVTGHVTDQFKVVARGAIQCSWSFLQYISARHFEAFLILCAISLYSWLDHWALLKPKFIN